MDMIAYFVTRDGGYVCGGCGAAIVVADPRRIVCESCASPRAGLGDMVAAGLESVGITKERVAAVARRVGIRDCGCQARQAKLNAIGKRLGVG